MELPQVELFNNLRKLIPPHISIATWLCELLKIDQSNAYRRIRGDKHLSFSEYMTICEKVTHLQHFAINYHGNSHNLSAAISSFCDIKSLENYLIKLIDDLQNLSSQNHQLSYVARDLPLFCFYATPALMNYKFNVWLRSSSSAKRFYLPEGIIKLGKRVFELYQKINSDELWYSWSLVNQIEQIKFWLAMDYLTVAKAGKICRDLEKALTLYENWLSIGEKPGGGKLAISLNDFGTMNNGGLFVTEKESVLMNGFQGTNYLITKNPNAIKIFKQHWEQHKSFAQPLTGTNTQLRHNFFKYLTMSLQKIYNQSVIKENNISVII